MFRSLDRWMERAWTNALQVFTPQPSSAIVLSSERRRTLQSPNRCRLPSTRHNRCDECSTKRSSFDTERSIHETIRCPRFTFVLDDHPIRSLEPVVDRYATITHLNAHLIGQLDRAITAEEILAKDEARKYINELHANLLLALHRISLHGPVPITDQKLTIKDINDSLVELILKKQLVLDATWQKWLENELERILHLSTASEPKQTSRKKKCLVLDLDRTLWFRSYRAIETADFVASYRASRNRTSNSIYVSIRPGAQFLLDSLAPHYDIAIYTASGRKCTDDLVDLLDTKHHIKYRLYRDSCTTDASTPSNLFKNLEALGRPRSEIVIVDDNPDAWLSSPENTIICKEYAGSKRDMEMYSITHQLLALHDVEDVRPHLLAATTKIQAA